MQDARNIKRIPLTRAADSPRLNAPAGYVVVIEDVEYGNRFIIVRLQELGRASVARAAAFPFATEMFAVFSAADAAALALELRDRFAASGDIGDWFDLDAAQVAQLRDFGRPAAPSLRDLALNEAEGQSLFQKAQVISSAPESPPVQARVAPKRPQRRWAAWLLLLVIITLGASLAANAPQLRRLISGGTGRAETPAQRRVAASATADRSPTPQRIAATSRPSPEAAMRAGEVFYLLARANARVCASRECRAAVILAPGTRIVAQRYERGESIGGDRTWIAFNRAGTVLYIHSAVLSRNRPTASNTARPSPTASLTAVPSATPALTDTPPPTATAAVIVPTSTDEPTATEEPTATAPLTETPVPKATATSEPAATATATLTETRAPTATATIERTATATDLPTVLYIDTANNLNANVRACPSTDCDILGKLSPGAAVRPTAEVEGEVINGIATWIEFDYDGQTGYVHGELVAASA